MTSPRALTPILTLVLLLALGIGWALRPGVRPAAEDESREHALSGPGHDPGDWFYAQRADRDGTFPQARYVAALEQARLERVRSRAAMSA